VEESKEFENSTDFGNNVVITFSSGDDLEIRSKQINSEMMKDFTTRFHKGIEFIIIEDDELKLVHHIRVDKINYITCYLNEKK